MTQHILDTDKLEKLEKFSLEVVLQNDDGDKWVRASEVRALIANSPQADGIDIIEYETLKERAQIDHVRQLAYWKILVKHGLAEEAEQAVSAYKPQADDVPPDVYDIVVDTGDGIYHTAEVVHFQQSGSKRMIQVRLGEPKADDVRKDTEREWVPKFPVGSKVVFYQKHPESPLDKEPTFGTVESYYDWNTAECGEHYTIKMAVVDVDGIKIKVEHNCLLAIDKARE